ncbi:MAG: hypothetical protein M1814_002073 [Vezdaea aestivalis]|nr:MAG: hypothetical protein M1814_002073 [Vezdaea aestivalis]
MVAVRNISLPRPESTLTKVRDPNTVSNYHEFVTTHTKVDFQIDFPGQKLTGRVLLQLTSLADSVADTITLDTSYLDINDVQLGPDANHVESISRDQWQVLDRVEPLGSPLKITLPRRASRGEQVTVGIKLSTTSQCTALQWMSPAQTPNKRHPYMFSQCQAIHARSIFPCQDTPGVKSTFDFKLASPLPVLASGLPAGAHTFLPGNGKDKPGSLVYSFVQRVPIPSYLFAVASGDLACASIGPRSTVWTGPEQLTGAKWEMEDDMERFLQTAEKLVFPYAWTSYNVLVLPPSFPYGGMENPVFTFATPTIISGDRQNIDVIAHELSHSWSGNLVSCASWEHFWINEGWTTYLERRIGGILHGELFRDFSSIIGWKALVDSIEQFGAEHEYTKLIPSLEKGDPDEAFSSVPYEKGHTFLLYLEQVVSIEKWDKFIPHYFDKYREKSLDSFQFKSTLLEFFSNDPEASKALTEVDWDTWFFAPGLPPRPRFDETWVQSCYALADKWKSRSQSSSSITFEPSKSDMAGWVANQTVVFLEKVQSFDEPLKKDEVALMGRVYEFEMSQNVEITSRYLEIGLMSRLEAVYLPVADLLGKVGRMKFVRPLYKLLREVDSKLAQKTFERNIDFYHPICRKMIETILAHRE